VPLLVMDAYPVGLWVGQAEAGPLDVAKKEALVRSDGSGGAR
jgi:hypothetical protein